MVLLSIGLFFMLYFGLMAFCVLYMLWAVLFVPVRCCGLASPVALRRR